MVDSLDVVQSMLLENIRSGLSHMELPGGGPLDFALVTFPRDLAVSNVNVMTDMDVKPERAIEALQVALGQLLEGGR